MIQFKATRGEYLVIVEIVKRASKLHDKFEMSEPLDILELQMDLNATHSNGTPLNLAELLAFGDGDFAHDVFGIRKHINRETGKLMDCFMPRCSYSQQEKLSLGI